MEFVLIQESLEALKNSDNIWTAITYIFSTAGGGVLYKYVSSWLSHKNNNANRTQELSEKLLVNLSKRVEQLEVKVDDSHNRELVVTRALATSEEEVRNLREEVSKLTDIIEELKATIAAYVELYGTLKE